MPTSRSKGKLRWNTELRLGLLVMKDDLDLAWPDIVITFNKVFYESISACGLSQATYGQLNAQYNENEHPRFEEARNAPIEQREEMRSRITSASQQQGCLPLAQADHTMPTPPTTPSKLSNFSHRKRSYNGYRQSLNHSAVINTSLLTISDTSDSELSIRSRKKSRRSLFVVSPPLERKAIGSKITTIVPKSRKQAKPGATILHHTTTRKPIMITSQQDEDRQRPITRVPPEVANPPVHLLFRYWNKESQSPLTNRGFFAGRFRDEVPCDMPAPISTLSDTFDWHAVVNHFRKKCTIPSPFISTSNDFVWILRCAISDYKRGIEGHISIIDPAKISQRAIYHTQPLHNAVYHKLPFPDGEWLYHGMREFWIWAQIPSNAIVSTLPTTALFNLAARDPEVGAFLRLEQLTGSRAQYTKQVLPRFKDENVTLTQAVPAMARLCHALNLDVSRAQPISGLITDLIQQYGVRVNHLTQAEWQEAAVSFARAIGSARPYGLNTRNEFSMMIAFIDGVRWSTGEPNARYKPQKMATMVRRAMKIGLDSPADIVAAELESVKVGIFEYEQGQQEIIQGTARTKYLLNHEDDAHEVPTRIQAHVNFAAADDQVMRDVDEESMSCRQRARNAQRLIMPRSNRYHGTESESEYQDDDEDVSDFEA